jgi:hypothetical protein
MISTGSPRISDKHRYPERLLNKVWNLELHMHVEKMKKYFTIERDFK